MRLHIWEGSVHSLNGNFNPYCAPPWKAFNPASCEINTLDQFQLEVLTKSPHAIPWWRKSSDHLCHIPVQLESGYLSCSPSYPQWIFIHLSDKNPRLLARNEGLALFRHQMRVLSPALWKEEKWFSLAYKEVHGSAWLLLRTAFFLLIL